MMSMSGFDKRVGSLEQALAGLEDGMTLAAGGFGLCGIPENLISEVARRGTRNLTVISNNCGVDDFGLGLLLKQRQIRLAQAIPGQRFGEATEQARQVPAAEYEALQPGLLSYLLEERQAGRAQFALEDGIIRFRMCLLRVRHAC